MYNAGSLSKIKSIFSLTRYEQTRNNESPKVVYKILWRHRGTFMNFMMNPAEQKVFCFIWTNLTMVFYSIQIKPYHAFSSNKLKEYTYFKTHSNDWHDYPFVFMFS